MMLTGSAYATTADLRAAALGGGTMIHGWAFDGEDAATAGADITGNLNTLVQNENGGVHGGAEPDTHIVYDVAGWDASSKATSTYQDITDGDFGHGDAFATSIDIAPPATFSWEVVLQVGPRPISGGTWNLGYVISHRPGAQRGYFLWQGAAADGTLGDGFTSLTGGWVVGEATVVPAPLTEGDWYYMAGTYTVSAGAGSPSQVDLYAANLTNGDTTLTHTAFANPGSYEVGVAGPFGIGERFDTSGESFPGALDEVYLHEVALSGAVLQDHLDQLLIPEPATMSLLMIGGLGLIARRRRR